MSKRFSSAAGAHTALSANNATKIPVVDLFFIVFHALHAFQRTTGAQPAVHERIEVAVHDALDITGLHAGAQILLHAVGLENIAADLIAPRNTAFLAVKPFHLLLLRVEPL